jgi:molybdenum cofactor sulfurtransferase
MLTVWLRHLGVCCPGGLATAMGYEQWEWERMASAGHACGTEPRAIVHHLPTG